MNKYFESWKHEKFTGEKCVVCWDKLSHDTQICVLCGKQVEFCNDCEFTNNYQCEEILEGHLENEHSSVNLC